MRTVFSEFGYPSHLHSESGTQFTTSEFQTFSQRYNFKHTKSLPHYHESKSERYIGIVNNLMRKNPGSIGEGLLAYRCAPSTKSNIADNSQGDIENNSETNGYVLILLL